MGAKVIGQIKNYEPSHPPFQISDPQRKNTLVIGVPCFPGK